MEVVKKLELGNTSINDDGLEKEFEGSLNDSKCRWYFGWRITFSDSVGIFVNCVKNVQRPDGEIYICHISVQNIRWG